MTLPIHSNRPKKDSKITVDPIKSITHINSIKQLLTPKPRDFLLFTIGINNGIRTGDLLRLKVKDILNKKIGDTITIKEAKTGKDNIIMVNKAVYKALQSHLITANPAPDDYLFKSRIGSNQPITVQTVNRLMKTWTKTINLKGNYGAHSLRKTFGYIQRTHYGVGFEVLCKRFNHSSPTVTMRYLGISDDEVIEILQNEI